MSSYGYSPIFPLVNDVDGPYSMHQDLAENVKQNVKFLLLTNPGERIMTPDYGVGLKRFLFEQNAPAVAAQINNKISEQFKKFMPFLALKSSVISPPDDENLITVQVSYAIKPLSFEDTLKLLYLSSVGIGKSKVFRKFT